MTGAPPVRANAAPVNGASLDSHGIVTFAAPNRQPAPWRRRPPAPTAVSPGHPPDPAAMSPPMRVRSLIFKIVPLALFVVLVALPAFAKDEKPPAGKPGGAAPPGEDKDK